MKKKYVLIALSVIVIGLIVACGQMFTVRHVSVVFDNKTGLADENGVLKATGLNGRNNIFNIKESDLKKNIALAYPDNSIEVTNIERKFPNKIVIRVKERIPIFKIKVYSTVGGNTDMYVPTDKDFQRGALQNAESIKDLMLIEVSNFGVYETFDVQECKDMHTLVKALLDMSFEEEALPYFIQIIDFSEGYINVMLRETNAIISISPENIVDDTRVLFKRYLSLNPAGRYGVVLKR